jgi:hypothetical protein
MFIMYRKYTFKNSTQPVYMYAPCKNLCNTNIMKFASLLERVLPAFNIKLCFKSASLRCIYFFIFTSELCYIFGCSQMSMHKALGGLGNCFRERQLHENRNIGNWSSFGHRSQVTARDKVGFAQECVHFAAYFKCSLKWYPLWLFSVDVACFMVQKDT